MRFPFDEIQQRFCTRTIQAVALGHHESGRVLHNLCGVGVARINDRLGIQYELHQPLTASSLRDVLQVRAKRRFATDVVATRTALAVDLVGTLRIPRCGREDRQNRHKRVRHAWPVRNMAQRGHAFLSEPPH